MPSTLRVGSRGPEVERLQRLLNLIVKPSPPLVPDGDFGPKTRAAVIQFQHSVHLVPDGIVGPKTWAALEARSGGGGGGGGQPPASSGQLPNFNGGDKNATVAAIIAECKRQGVTLNAQIAYVLGTAEHESGFQPVREAFWLSEEWRRTHLRYYPYYGRGYVQLTWKHNYEKYGTLLGIPLVAQPDLALRPNVALFTLVHGMKTGTFTGKKLSDYITAAKTDFYNARRIVNGVDRAEHIASLARKWLETLR